VAISSYFFDSIEGDVRTYSAADFAKAFNIVFATGVILGDDGTTGFDVGGVNFTTIYAGKAIIEGHFVEVTDTEILTVPTGSYSGMIAIRLDSLEARTATLVVKTDQVAVKSADLYELPLYNCTVVNNIITAVTDVRTVGGAIVQGHSHVIADITNLQTTLNSKADDSNTVTWTSDPNGVIANIGKYAGTGKPIVLFLTAAQPAASASEHRVWIQIDNF
jgi:Phage tail repeat like